MFKDRTMPLAIAAKKSNHTSMGSFTYIDLESNGCPKLLHEETGKEIIVIQVTFSRSTLPLL